MYVLNAAFYKPALLSRDMQALDLLSDGRLEIGLGTGYVREEFEAAEMPYPSAGARVDYLEHMTKYLKEHHPSTPLIIAGNGDRVLTIAARNADIIGLTGSKVRRRRRPVRRTRRVRPQRRGRTVRLTRAEPGDHGDAADGETEPDLSMTRAVSPGPVRRGDPVPALGAQRFAPRDRRHVVRIPRKVRCHVVHRAGQQHRQLREGDRRAALTAAPAMMLAGLPVSSARPPS